MIVGSFALVGAAGSAPPVVARCQCCSIIAHMVLVPGELGERIAVARREAGLTQGACAARAAIERTALAKIETGARRVGAVELARLADALDVRIEWFFEDAPPSVVSRRNAAELGP